MAGLNLEIAESCSPGRGRPPGPPQLDEFLREVCGRQLAAAAVTAAPSRAAAAKKQDGPHQPAHSAEEGCKQESRHGRGVQLLENVRFGLSIMPMGMVVNLSHFVLLVLCSIM